MRHRSESDETKQAQATIWTGEPGRLLSLSELMASDAPVHGKHRATPGAQQIPAQMLPTHDQVTETPAVAEVVEEAALFTRPAHVPQPRTQTTTQTRTQTTTQTTTQPEAKVPAAQIPHEAQWRASHLPRLVAGILLVLAAVGTSGLGLRYAQTRSSENFLSLVIGVVVVVVLWALVIVGTPQVVRLNGSILDIQNTGGSEHFDLADGLQPVDLVGDPRTTHWAVLLHRPNGTTLVLRHNDVNAVELDPIVRHYRMVADQRYVEREARFNL